MHLDFASVFGFLCLFIIFLICVLIINFLFDSADASAADGRNSAGPSGVNVRMHTIYFGNPS